jgi:hypothetical protein
MKARRISIMILTFLLFQITAASITTGQTSTGVQDGEPLHLWLKRSPSQDLTTLSFYQPTVNDEMAADPKNRLAIGPNGQGDSMEVVYFPTHPENNFLQFEYNSTLTGSYNFTISAVLPQNATDIEFRLKVTIAFAEIRGEKVTIAFAEIRGDDYDIETSFIIKGQADSNRRTYTGVIEIESDLIERFDHEKGGRMKLTMERVDYIDTDVLLYCGYGNEFCSLNLPYSKYTYVPAGDDGEGFDWTVLIVVIGGSIVIIILVFLAFGIIGGNKKTEEDKSNVNPRSRRGRR